MLVMFTDDNDYSDPICLCLLRETVLNVFVFSGKNFLTVNDFFDLKHQ